MELAMTQKATWIIVTQVKSLRVVYFTDDQTYQPPTDNDHYYYCAHIGELPTEITLQNCWKWKFNGKNFLEANEEQKVTVEEAFLAANRRALMSILVEKINLIRAPYLPACNAGEQVRKLKLDEANRYLQLPNEKPMPNMFPLLEAIAVGNSMSLQESALLVQSKAAESQAILLQSERFKEQLTTAIKTASTQAQLISVREWLLDRVYPELTKNFKFTPDHTEPLNLDAPLSDFQRLQEIARLKVGLREWINVQRLPLHSDYVLNNDVRNWKLRVAKAVVENGESALTPEDLALLKPYATARKLKLKDAAMLLLNSAAVSSALLRSTENMKDRTIAQIDGIATLQDVKNVSFSVESRDEQ
jgi:hypothetical protein